MPRAVDPDQRLADIAEATLRVAFKTGAGSVTIRSVARELGGSTTLVTNYLPSRAALIMNALDRGRDRWLAERSEAVASLPAAQRLSAVMDWSLSSSADDLVLRTLILEIVANAELRQSLIRESDEFRAFVEDTARESGYADPRHVADLLYVVVRGSYIALMEDDRYWTESRVQDLVRTVIDGLPRVDQAAHAVASARP